jgi:hypothetical protein
MEKKEIMRSVIDIIAKIIIGLTAFVGLRVLDKIDNIEKSNANMLNSVIEIKIGMENNQERIFSLERDFKEFQKEYYTNKK